MIAACLPLSREVSKDLLEVAARAVCDRPGESPAQCESRTAQLVHSTLGFLPRDGLEYILATLVFGHWGMILDSMHDVHIGMTASLKARTKSGIVQMDRAMMDMVRELRAAAVRPALAARRREGVGAAAAGAAAEVPAEAPVEAPAKPPVEVLVEAPVRAPVEAAVEILAEVPVDAPVEAPADVQVEAPSAPVTVAAPAAPARQMVPAVAPMRAPSPPVAPIGAPPAPGEMLALVETMGDPERTAHVVAYEKALAEMYETLAEASANERAAMETNAAPGD